MYLLSRERDEGIESHSDYDMLLYYPQRVEGGLFIRAGVNARPQSRFFRHCCPTDFGIDGCLSVKSICPKQPQATGYPRLHSGNRRVCLNPGEGRAAGLFVIPVLPEAKDNSSCKPNGPCRQVPKVDIAQQSCQTSQMTPRAAQSICCSPLEPAKSRFPYVFQRFMFVLYLL